MRKRESKFYKDNFNNGKGLSQRKNLDSFMKKGLFFLLKKQTPLKKTDDRVKSSRCFTFYLLFSFFQIFEVF